MERLVAGRERIYLDRFWNEFSAKPSRFTEAARRHYAKLYARPPAMHAGFAQFAAFDQDAADNEAFLAEGKLSVPVLALGGEKSFGTTMAAVMRFPANEVENPANEVEKEIVPNSGHWIVEDNSKATVGAVRAFVNRTEGAGSEIAFAAARVTVMLFRPLGRDRRLRMGAVAPAIEVCLDVSIGTQRCRRDWERCCRGRTWWHRRVSWREAARGRSSSHFSAVV